jgi:hypothetical protein
VRLFEANSRATKRVERLKVEVVKKLEGQGKTSSPTQCTYRDVYSTGIGQSLCMSWLHMMQALPHRAAGNKESALHALSASLPSVSAKPQAAVRNASTSVSGSCTTNSSRTLLEPVSEHPSEESIG